VPLTAGATAGGKSFAFRRIAGAKVSTFDFPFQTGQRLVFTFDRDVNPNIPDSALEVVNQTTGQTIAAHVSYISTSRTAVWNFAGLANGLLPDGNYTARLKASAVTLTNGGMLDGNGDGAGGDDYVASFFQLNGDANRDRVVDTADFRIVLANYNTTIGDWTHGDFNYDGAVDFADFQALELSFGHSLPAATSSAVVVVSDETLASVVAVADRQPTSAARPTLALPPIRRRRMDLLDHPAPPRRP